MPDTYNRETEREKLSANEKKVFDAVLANLGITDGENGFKFRAVPKPATSEKLKTEHIYEYSADGIVIYISADAYCTGDFYLKVFRKQEEAGKIDQVNMRAHVGADGSITVPEDAGGSVIYFSGRRGERRPLITIYSQEPHRSQAVEVVNNTRPGVKVPTELKDTSVDTAVRLMHVTKQLLGLI